jgi:hypothetical protein
MRSQIAVSDYAIIIPEREFVSDPAGSINRATNLTEPELRQRLAGLAWIQRLVIVDHPRSLFVEAFSQETMASWHEDYYNFPELDYHNVGRFPPPAVQH